MILKILLISWIGVRWRLGRSILTAMSLFIGVLTIVVIQAGAKSAQNAIVADAILSSGKAMTLSGKAGLRWRPIPMKIVG